MSFFHFYRIWFSELLRGWKFIFLQVFFFFFEVVRNLKKGFWLLFIASLLLIAVILLPWFSYQIRLLEPETLFLRTKKWYFFSLPAVTALLFLLVHHRLFYFLQLVLNSIFLVFFLYSMYDTSLHISVKGEYRVLPAFYFYFIVLIIHTFFSSFLKEKENTVLFSVYKVWKDRKKKAN